MLVRTVPDQHKREATNLLVSDTILTLCFLFLPFRDLGKTTTSTATTSIQQLSLSTRAHAPCHPGPSDPQAKTRGLQLLRTSAKWAAEIACLP